MKNFNLKEAIRKKRIIPFSDGPKVVSKEIATAREDLKDAKDVLALGKTKLATVSAYYAIFHATRALLYTKKYREKSHIQLGFAIKSLFVDTGLFPIEYYDNFIQALNLREMADYKRTFSKEGAEKNIEAAKKAIKQAASFLSKRAKK
ncbi:MAG: HEPN domain-containing protein [Candidatus Omnitrophica bacterium]|nr:HEPN domain-containing protein [Candidatus Omnitrophota bacterium]MBU1128302.1 HEPN domain-containing protein [Candidatus Omnitrophota bacterium]MBU1657106.1 HEPN domain-containing protein [Candidatus Omnitrophota bacterium]MBU1784138.1 HEPN domain-containing protein [Candidatus Omnitrophota bacterium]